MPVKISRTKRAPVAAASAIELIGSHSTLTPNGTRDLRAQRADDIGHRRGRGGVDRELVGPVVLVAEHHGIDAGRLQRLRGPSAAPSTNARHPGLGIVQRRAGQRAEMHHGDHRLLDAEHAAEFLSHGCPLSDCNI